VTLCSSPYGIKQDEASFLNPVHQIANKYVLILQDCERLQPCTSISHFARLVELQDKILEPAVAEKCGEHIFENLNHLVSFPF
jgi:hypothetical protein